MHPDVPVRTMMERTIKNYELVKKVREDQLLARSQRLEPDFEVEAFEVTQLVNSFLGAFAHPWESWRDSLSAISIEQAERDGWPKVRPMHSLDEKPEDLDDLLRLIRNAIAHGNIEYRGDKNQEIASLYIWNERKKIRTWATELSVKTLEQLLYKVFEIASELDDPVARRPPRHRGA